MAVATTLHACTVTCPHWGVLTVLAISSRLLGTPAYCLTWSPHQRGCGNHITTRLRGCDRTDQTPVQMTSGMTYHLARVDFTGTGCVAPTGVTPSFHVIGAGRSSPLTSVACLTGTQKEGFHSRTARSTRVATTTRSQYGRSSTRSTSGANIT
eukprot:COSAG02_NODE_3254_length_7085_cov_102.140281_3_plen_153_part_00